MNPQAADENHNEWKRRDFIRGTSFGALMMMMGGVPLHAEDKAPATADAAPTKYNTIGPPLSIGLIGCGFWGREILQTLALLPNAPVAGICETYEPFLRRAKEYAPKAESYTDYHKMLEQKEVEGVIIATPTHQHREIVEAALKAGKHVYCEAPLANTPEDSKAIAQAAKAAGKVYFQSGLQYRADPHRQFLVPFIRSGAIGKNIMARSQWHKKTSWRRASPNPEREKEINWRMSKAVSTGLMGEIGIHQIDLVGWFANSTPTAVAGYGGIMHWNDGRDVPDTVQTVLEYPGNVNLTYDATLANHFDGEYDIIYGVDAAVMMRGSKAWLFKEVDSPLLGWEVYARKDEFYEETGIALVANATKSVVAAKSGEENPFADSPLHHALVAFVQNSKVIGAGVDDFTTNFGGGDDSALREYLGGLSGSLRPAAGYKEGYEATIVALKANEAVMKGQKVAISKEALEI